MERASMRLGFFGANVGGMASPQALEVAQFAEALGYASIWAGDHVVLPKPRREKPPLDPDWPMADPLLTLSYIAGGTRHLRLATGVLVATQYQPVRLAKQAVHESAGTIPGVRRGHGVALDRGVPPVRGGVRLVLRCGRSPETRHAGRTTPGDG